MSHGRLLNGHALKHGQGIPNGGAVADHGHRLAGVVTGDLPDGGGDALPQALEGLAALHTPTGIRGVEPSELLCVGAVDLPPGPVLPNAHRNLPQGLPGDQGQALGFVDGPGGGPGAEEVAGVHRVHMDGFEPVGQSGDLPVAQVGDQAVVMAVDAAVEVPLGFRVADQVDLSHG